MERHHIEALVLLAESGFCMHRSWGFGRIKTVDTVFARFTIDFANKAGPHHGPGVCRRIPQANPQETTFSRAKPPTSRACGNWPRRNHLELVKLVLSSYGGKATVEQIQQVLVPDVIRDDWKKWWEAAKRELKKDGHFQVPLKKTEPIIYQEKEVSLQDRLLEEFRAAKGLKARIAVASRIAPQRRAISRIRQAAAGGSHRRVQRRDCQLPAHPTRGGARGDLCPRRHPRAWPSVPPAEGELSASGDLGRRMQARPAVGAASRRQTSPGARVLQGGQPGALGRCRCGWR